MKLKGKQIGSQFRVLLRDSGYKLMSRPDKGVVILKPDSGPAEMWYANNDHSG